MTVSELPIIVATGRERPTHGYAIGQALWDSTEDRWYKLASRNPHIWRHADISSIYNKAGKCEFHCNTLKADGILADMTALGTFGRGMDANGTNNSAQTGTGSIINAGFGLLYSITSDFSGFTRNSFLPYYRIKGLVPLVNSIGAGADTRFYSGWIKNSTGPAISDTPLLQAEGGIVVGFGTNDSTWQVWHGNGTDPIVKEALASVPVVGAITQYRIEMIYTTATNIVINILNSSDTLLQTKTVNTDVLASGKSINWVHVVQNPSTTPTKTAHGLKMDMRVVQ